MDKEDAVFKRVSPEFQRDYGRIVWVQTSNMNPWWPCFVFNPTKLPSDLKLKAAKLINKNHAVYFYGDTDKFDFVTPHQMQRRSHFAYLQFTMSAINTLSSCCLFLCPSLFLLTFSSLFSFRGFFILGAFSLRGLASVWSPVESSWAFCFFPRGFFF